MYRDSSATFAHCRHCCNRERLSAAQGGTGFGDARVASLKLVQLFVRGQQRTLSHAGLADPRVAGLPEFGPPNPILALAT
jgi:hypothetical protein